MTTLKIKSGLYIENDKREKYNEKNVKEQDSMDMITS